MGAETVALARSNSFGEKLRRGFDRLLAKTARPDILDVAHDCPLATGARSKCGTSVVDVAFSPEVSLDKRRIRWNEVTIMCSA
jgi:hypothetical protein